MTRISEITNDSETSSMDGGSPEDRHIKNFCKSMVKNSLFIGRFYEKRYVASLNAYRDIVKISDDEKDFIQNVLAVKKRCANYYSKPTWIGITEPDPASSETGYNLWVTLDEEVFGLYWFKVKRVLFRPNEVIFKLETVRRVTNENPIDSSEHTEQSFKEMLDEFDKEAKKRIKESVTHLFNVVLTRKNIIDAITFISLLIFSLVTILIEAVKFIMEYTLKFVRECSGLIVALTPFLQSLVGFFTTTINGFYRLIAMMFLNARTPTPPQQVITLVDMNKMGADMRGRALEYRGNDGWNYNVNPRYRSSVRM